MHRASSSWYNSSEVYQWNLGKSRKLMVPYFWTLELKKRTHPVMHSSGQASYYHHHRTELPCALWAGSWPGVRGLGGRERITLVEAYGGNSRVGRNVFPFCLVHAQLTVFSSLPAVSELAVSSRCPRRTDKNGIDFFETRTPRWPLPVQPPVTTLTLGLSFGHPYQSSEISQGKE